MSRLVVIAIVAAALGAATTAPAARTIARCRGAQLVGSFKAVVGSAGAGNITYALRLKNRSAAACTLTGLPDGTLLGIGRKALPTRIRAGFPGALSAVLVTLAPGRVARADARFSPDVPGPGEQSTGRCEPVVWWFRVVGQGGGRVTVRVAPRTPVCEHGQLLFSAYGPA